MKLTTSTHLASSSLVALLQFSATTLLVSAQPYANCDLSAYYSALPSSSSPLPAAASRADMHALLMSTHRNQLPYTSSSSPDVWDAMVALDGDAAGLNVKLVYADELVPASPRDAGTCQYWNREHLWPRSLGVGSTGKDNTDVHHLRPADCNVNSARSNLYFGACGTASPSSTCTSPAHLEAAPDTAKDSSTFLPPVDRRGDVARAILYMDLRYDGGESNALDLVVSDCPETVPNGAGMGYLSQLLQWHLEDPPDGDERARNGKVCSDWQGNRNPFIDYPELASLYHGGPRPLLGDGLGYDCTVPPPPPGTKSPTVSPTDPPTFPPGTGFCSDDSTATCTATDQCACASAPAPLFRNLLRGTSNQHRSLQTTSKLIVTGVFDGPLTGGLPKMMELYALDDISDLSAYGVGSANNGGGTDGQEFSLSGSVSAGGFVTVASESVGYASYFGGATPTFVSGALNVNGDDAIELFFQGTVVDTYGDITTDGTGQVWEYMDGWAYRLAESAPAGGSFQISEWTLSGANAVDGCTTNDACGSSFPFGTFLSGFTRSPSSSPTTQPTKPCECVGAYSGAPTAVPTKSPLASPMTTDPTASPSKSPSPPPVTTDPTIGPSKTPTSTPTKIPTENPTGSPSTPLSNSPTSSPSKTPSEKPVTTNPSASPSKGPTLSPSKVPSKNPTSSPSTQAPSISPTDPPSNAPATPTSSPTLPREGYCSDNTGRCSPTDLSECGCNTNNPASAALFARNRYLIKGKEVTVESIRKTGTQSRYLAKKTPSPTPLPTPGPTQPPMTPSPTGGPTTQPTSPPTVTLSSLPTGSPTVPAECTCLSTAFPTSEPSVELTKNPTSPPTLPLTSEPTASPTEPLVQACVCDGFTVKNACNDCSSCKWNRNTGCNPR